jgi:sec-independent protein translocase protein TatA
MSIGPGQLILIVLLFLILFGAGRVSQLMADVAKGIKSFKKSMGEEDEDQKTEEVKKEEPLTTLLINEKGSSHDIESR